MLRSNSGGLKATMDAFPAMAAELVGLPVAVLVTGGGEGTAFAAKAATNTIPIVCNVGSDPVKSGLVAGLSRPGGNITGINILTSELATKRVGLLHDLVPNISVFAHLVNPNFANGATIYAIAGRRGDRIAMLFAALHDCFWPKADIPSCGLSAIADTSPHIDRSY
jgi:hypothetical protein